MQHSELNRLHGVLHLKQVHDLRPLHVDELFTLILLPKFLEVPAYFELVDLQANHVDESNQRYEHSQIVIPKQLGDHLDVKQKSSQILRKKIGALSRAQIVTLDKMR